MSSVLRTQILKGINLGIALFLLVLPVRFFLGIAGEISPASVRAILFLHPFMDLNQALSSLLLFLGIHFLLPLIPRRGD